MSKRTHWEKVADNITDFRTEDQKKRDRLKAFKVGLALEKMKTEKPKIEGDKPFYAKKKKKENPDGQKSSEDIESGM